MPLKPPPTGLQPLHEARIARRMTQAELGRLVRMDQPTLSRLETGVLIPTRVQLARLVKVLGVRPTTLFSATILAEVERRYQVQKAVAR